LNREYVLHNLREAREDLGRSIAEFVADANYSEAEFYVVMQHLYHHLNTAWNARESSEGQAQECSAEDFDRWRQFPVDLDLSSE
jgi:hypothetical protein